MMLDSLIVEFYILTIALHKPFCSHESFKKKKRRKKKTVLVNISVILQTAVICHCGSLGIINHVVFNKSIRVEMTHIQYVINTRCHLDGLKFKWYKNSVFLTGSDSLWLCWVGGFETLEIVTVPAFQVCTGEPTRYMEIIQVLWIFWNKSRYWRSSRENMQSI